MYRLRSVQDEGYARYLSRSVPPNYTKVSQDKLVRNEMLDINRG